MSDIQIPDKTSLKCLFCGSDKFKVEHQKDGSIVKQEFYECGNCGQQNSYEGLVEVCKEEIVGLVKEGFQKMLKDIFKK